jgi:hypothetical protein
MFVFDINILASITYFASSSSTDSAVMVAGFQKFLQSLGADQKYDHLRLALQASSLLTPILLLHGVQIHQSETYAKWYNMILVCAVSC